MPGLRFGLQLPSFGPTASAEAVLVTAELAESLGFDSIWVNDHVLAPARMADQGYGNMFECLTTLTAVAVVTKRIRIGSSILVLPQREPVLAAKQLAMVDVFSGGRSIAGVAAGYVAEEFDFLGASLERRGRRLEESLELMRTLWRGDGAFRGEWFHFEDAIFGPLPPQGDALPIWMGGTTAAAIKRAARIADAWHGARIAPAQLRNDVALLRQHAGDRKVGVTLKLRCGLPGVVGGVSHDAADFPESHDLIGTPEELVDQLGDYVSAGLEEIVLLVYHDHIPALHETLHHLAIDVMPQFRDGQPLA